MAQPKLRVALMMICLLASKSKTGKRTCQQLLWCAVINWDGRGTFRCNLFIIFCNILSTNISRRNTNFQFLRLFRISADAASRAYWKHLQASRLQNQSPSVSPGQQINRILICFVVFGFYIIPYCRWINTLNSSSTQEEQQEACEAIERSLQLLPLHDYSALLHLAGGDVARPHHH